MKSTWHLEQLSFSIPILGHLITDLTEEQVHTLRDGGTGWTVAEVMCHLRDYEQIFMERIRLTQTEENPDLPAPDQDQLAIDENYNEISPYEAYLQWEHHRKETLELINNITDWERTGVHPRRGPMTLTEQIQLICWHDMNHMQQMVSILSEE